MKRRIVRLVSGSLILSIVLLMGTPAKNAFAEGFSLSGSTSSSTGDVAGAIVEVDVVNTNTAVATTTVDEYGNYTVSNLPYGTYDLHITPLNTSDLLPYVATIDLFETVSNFNPILSSSAPDTALFTGKMLLNNAGPGYYYQSYYSGLFQGFTIGGYGTVNVNPDTGEFSTRIPVNTAYDLRVPVYHSSFLETGAEIYTTDRGLDEVSSQLNLGHDVYRAYNINTSENTTHVTNTVVNECNQPLPNALVSFSAFGHFHFSPTVTARAFYRVVQTYTDTNGKLSYDIQLASHEGYGNVRYGGQNYEVGLNDFNPINRIIKINTNSDCDNVAPIVIGHADHAANLNGWYNSSVTVNWQATDPSPSSGTPTTPSPTLANVEGTHNYTSGQSCDPAGNCTTGSTTLSIDTVPGSGSFSGSTLVIRLLLAQKIMGIATDATSGVAKVEILSGTTALSSNPGGGITLSCNTTKTSCSWVADPTSLPGGSQTLTLKVTDLAGNIFTTTKNYILL